MYLFEIETPGVWLDIPDQECRFQLGSQLNQLKSIFVEANVALNLFEHANHDHRQSMRSDNWHQDSERKSEIRQQVEDEHGGFSFDNHDEITLEADRRFLRETIAVGRLPTEHHAKIPFLHARSFLYALDSFDRHLEVLSKENGVPDSLALLHARVAIEFPDLRGVRNTAHHKEDRGRGLGSGRNPQPMTLAPVENGAVSAPAGGVLMLDMLNGSNYGSTMASGHYGEVPVTAESMEKLQEILTAVLTAFRWTGPRELTPRA